MSQYNIIYADPPWRFNTYSDKGKDRSPENHYQCMDLDWIKNLPVSDITADDSVLFLWSIGSMLPEALDVMKAWGFTYKTVGFTWVKENMKSPGYFTGLGYWTRCNPEYCLLGTRGKPKRVSKAVRELVVTPRQAHSVKPERVRQDIVDLCGDLPRVELFARQATEGWDVFGNEVKGSIQLC